MTGIKFTISTSITCNSFPQPGNKRLASGDGIKALYMLGGYSGQRSTSFLQLCIHTSQRSLFKFFVHLYRQMKNHNEIKNIYIKTFLFSHNKMSSCVSNLQEITTTTTLLPLFKCILSNVMEKITGTDKSYSE